MSPKWGVPSLAIFHGMNVNRAPVDYFLGMMALSARRRAGTFAGAPLNLSVGPVTWESDNSGLGILVGADVKTELWTDRPTLVALESLYFAPPRGVVRIPRRSCPTRRQTIRASRFVSGLANCSIRACVVWV
jgi:hypothetical protein